jgi:hypothetical protein
MDGDNDTYTDSKEYLITQKRAGSHKMHKGRKKV